MNFNDLNNSLDINPTEYLSNVVDDSHFNVKPTYKPKSQRDVSREHIESMPWKIKNTLNAKGCQTQH